MERELERQDFIEIERLFIKSSLQRRIRFERGDEEGEESKAFFMIT